MIINDYYKFVYVRTIKTASATLHHILSQLPSSVTARDIWGSETEHQTITEISDYMSETHRDISDYLTFTVVRNPWDWLNSMYYHEQYMIDIWNSSTDSDRIQRSSHSIYTDWVDDHPDRVTMGIITPWRDFSEFWDSTPDLHTYNTNIYLGESDIDFYIKYEHLHTQCDMLTELLNLPSQVSDDIRKIRLNSQARCQGDFVKFTPEILRDIPQKFIKEITLHSYEPPDCYTQ